MGSWHYAYFFPAHKRPLLPAKGIDALESCDLELLETIRLATDMDDEGHVEFAGAQIALRPPFLEDVRRRLENGEQFLLESHNSDILISICFATRSYNPHVLFGWSRKQFARLDVSVQERYFEMLRKFARESRAGYVIQVDDPPDHFEDRFVEVDGHRLLETQAPDGYRYDIRAVWVDRAAELPHGVSLPARDIGMGFLDVSVSPARDGYSQG